MTEKELQDFKLPRIDTDKELIGFINEMILGVKGMSEEDLERKVEKKKEIEKLRKRTRKNWKRETRAKYRNLMNLAKFKIKEATDNYCCIKRHYSRKEYFALWLVAKKLEAKGFKCELEKGEWSCSGLFDYDKLLIDWE